MVAGSVDAWHAAFNALNVSHRLTPG